MKILISPSHYIYDDRDRGSELSWAYQISNFLASKYPNSIVVTGSRNDKLNKKYNVIELQKGKKNVDLGFKNAFLFNFLYSKFAIKKLREERFDVLFHLLPFGLDKTYNFSIIFGAKNVRKIIGPVQNQLPYFKDNVYDKNLKTKSSRLDYNSFIFTYILNPILKYFSTLTLKKSDAVIVVNRKTKIILLDRKIEDKKIHIIPPGVNCDLFMPVSKSLNKKIEILAAGTLMDRKRFDLILKSLPSVVLENSNFILRIVGDGPNMKSLKKMAKDLSIEKFVEFEGYVSHENMHKYFKNADIFVSMSYAEGFATVSLEAIASGLPIVSTRVGGFEDVVKDGQNGYIIEVDDYDDFSKKLNYLINNPDLIKKMGKISREIATAKYDWEKVIFPKYNNLITEVLN